MEPTNPHHTLPNDHSTLTIKSDIKMHAAGMIGKASQTIVLSAGLLLSGQPHAATAASVTTYHNDTMRTGWNANETALTPRTVSTSAFKQLATVTLDEQVDTEPLYVAGQSISGKGVHDTVYVATENNTVYAIDATTGQILLQRNLGPAVPSTQLPGGCPNNSATVGINSTPVIDPISQTLYVISYNYGTGAQRYWLNALDLATLNNKLPRAAIEPTAPLANGKTYWFHPTTARQRSALLLANGNVYAAFTAFCDNDPSVTRGWIMGWQASTLKLLDKGLTNSLATSPKSYFLSTIWMSGYGVSADAAGSLYFVTGNSDPAGTAYYPNNLAESVVKMRSDLAEVQSYFTPGTAETGRAALDLHDQDFGSGGVLVIPQQPGSYPSLAVAAGKVGTLYLMDQDSLGGYTDGADKVLGSVDIGECYCGEAYYQGADGIGRVVTSGGQQVKVWRIVTSASAVPRLVLESTSTALDTGQDSGFFTSITSNGTTARSQVIWALSRPNRTNSAGIQLYAFDPSTRSGAGISRSLFSGLAGNWPNGDGNANLVPLVANGRVFVASYKEMTIFGLVPAGSTQVAADKGRPAPTPMSETSQPDLPGHAIYGKLRTVDDAMLTIETRNGAMVKVDSTAARKAEVSALPIVGRALLVRGEYDKSGILHATSIARVKDQSELWKADR